MPETTESPVTVKVFRFPGGSGRPEEIGGYLDDIIAREALAQIVGDCLDRAPDEETRAAWQRQIDGMREGLWNTSWYQGDRYVVDDPQARTDKGDRRRCPQCGDQVDDTRFMNQPCGWCMGENALDELEQARERLAAFEELRAKAEEWAEARRLAANTDAVGDWEAQGDHAEDLADQLCKLLGISR